MQPLDRLRLRVTAWYAGTFLVVLLVVGTALFFAISRRRDASLDRSLARAAEEIVRATSRPARATSAVVGERPPTRAADVGDLVELRIPDRMLYLLDARGVPLHPDTASAWVRAAARRAARTGEAALEADIGHEHTLRVRALRFRGRRGDALVAVAAADTEELEDEFAALITLFVGALALALAGVTAGGWLLARKSTAPVERSIERMRRFVADAAHELRTPVSVLRAQADVALQQPRAAGDYERLLREIGVETDRLGTIVNDLFTLARADAGERRVGNERFYLDDVALDAANGVRAVATQCGVRVDVAALDESPVDGDPALVRQLIAIVLDNAIKYTGAGGVVTLSVGDGARGPRIVVEDTGMGIPAEALPHVEERFFRAESARTRADGAGLGLSIARWIADAHRATLEITSTVGRGTRVEVGFRAVSRRR